MKAGDYEKAIVARSITKTTHGEKHQLAFLIDVFPLINHAKGLEEALSKAIKLLEQSAYPYDEACMVLRKTLGRT